MHDLSAAVDKFLIQIFAKGCSNFPPPPLQSNSDLLWRFRAWKFVWLALSGLQLLCLVVRTVVSDTQEEVPSLIHGQSMQRLK